MGNIDGRVDTDEPVGFPLSSLHRGKRDTRSTAGRHSVHCLSVTVIYTLAGREDEFPVGR